MGITTVQTPLITSANAAADKPARAFAPAFPPATSLQQNPLSNPDFFSNSRLELSQETISLLQEANEPAETVQSSVRDVNQQNIQLTEGEDLLAISEDNSEINENEASEEEEDNNELSEQLEAFLKADSLGEEQEPSSTFETEA